MKRAALPAHVLEDLEHVRAAGNFAEDGSRPLSESHRAAREIAGLPPSGSAAAEQAAASPAGASPRPSRGTERRPSRAHRKYQADLRWLEDKRAELAKRPGAPDLFTVVPRPIWEFASRCMGSRSAAWYELCRAGNRAAIGAIRRAAFGGRRTWQSSYALRVIVLGLVELELSKHSRRNKRAGGSRWAYTFQGIPRELLCLLLRDPHSGHVPTVGALAGWHRPNGDVDNGQIGYLRALELSGFHKRWQEQRPTRWNPDIEPTCNVYAIVGHTAYAFGEALEELLQLIGEADEIEKPNPRGPPRAHAAQRAASA